VATVGIFLIAIALIVVMVGCNGGGGVEYDLTMAVSLGGSGTATDLTNASPYTAGTNVSIKAVAAAGYEFVSWTAPAGTFADANAVQTTFTMPAQQVTVTANFFQGQLIRDWQDLHAIRDDPGDNYLLMNALDSTTAGYTERASPTANGGKGWQPIGSFNASYDPVDPFTGTFDGQGYEIRDLFIDRPDEDGVGLFGAVVGAVIENVGMVDADVTGSWGVGGLVGYNEYGTVSNSHATGSVDGDYDVGGLVGYNEDGTVSDSYATGNVTGTYDVGGLVGQNDEGSVDNSYATGSVDGDYDVGGLVGYNEDDGDVCNSYSTGSVDGVDDVGGLVGYNKGGTVSDSFWDTQTSGQDTSDGGTGKTTEEMMDIDTFTDAETEGLDEPWDIIAVDNSNERDTGYIWNIVDDVTYPFLSWQPVS